jgi:hypothetical protein
MRRKTTPRPRRHRPGRRLRRGRPRPPAYGATRAAAARFLGSYPLGAPEATGAAILAIVDAEEPPLRVLLGGPPLQMARDAYTRRLATWEQWERVSEAA